MSVAPILTLIAPVKDEEEAIAPFLARVAPILDGLFADGAWEILFVDDGSEDGTLAAILKAPWRRPPRPRAVAVAQFRQGGGADRRPRPRRAARR